MMDTKLVASGLPPQRDFYPDWRVLSAWLGEDAEPIFNDDSIKRKRAYLRDLIARERAGKSKGEQR